MILTDLFTKYRVPQYDRYYGGVHKSQVGGTRVLQLPHGLTNCAMLKIHDNKLIDGSFGIQVETKAIEETHKIP